MNLRNGFNWLAPLLALFLLITTNSALATQWHVAPDGRADGDGLAQPWDLQTALFGAPTSDGIMRIGPGDTVLLHGGTYQGGFECNLVGTEEQPIVVRQAPGERAIIDCKRREDKDNGLFAVKGAHTLYWGFEITCSDPHRVTTIAGSWPDDIHRGGVGVYGSHIKLVNMLIHDTGGIGAWAEGEGSEIYGCLIFHNGWKGPDRGHGHAIYAQNRTGTKRLIDNVMFNQFSYGIHCYGSEKAFLEGFQIEGNASFNNGSLSGPLGSAPGIMAGGGAPVKRLQITHNFLYGGGMRCGYPWGVPNEDAVIEHNYIGGSLAVRDFKQLTVAHNTIISTDSVVSMETERSELPATDSWNWNHNEYFRTTTQYSDFQILRGDKATGLEFDEWRMLTSVDKDSVYQEQSPHGVQVFVRPNQYEPGRAHVIVYNWDGLDWVDVDLSEVLKEGQQFRIVSAQNFDGAPIVEGTLANQGKVTLPMRTVVQAAQPVGMPDFSVPVTEPEFGVFVVLPVNN